MGNRARSDLTTVGELAGELGILSSRVRFYSNMGLLSEHSRTRGGYRLFRKTETLARLRRIAHLQEKGLSLERIKAKLAKAPDLAGLLKDTPVRFAYLFGSHAKGSAGSLSDVDIAVFLDERAVRERALPTRLDLAGRLARHHGTDRIDLVVLNESPLLLRFQVVRHGRLLYSIDERKRIRFEAETMGRYFDQSYYHKRHARATIDRIAREGIL